MISPEFMQWLLMRAQALYQYIKDLFNDDDDWMNPDLVRC